MNSPAREPGTFADVVKAVFGETCGLETLGEQATNYIARKEAPCRVCCDG